MRTLLVFLLCLAALPVTAMSKFTWVGEIPAQAEYLGVRTFRFEDSQRRRPVVVEIWYPTNQLGPFDPSEDPIWVHPKERRDASLPQQRHPLILLSHGNRGDRRDRSWLAECLVRKGYLVASVEHFGNAWDTFTPHLSLRFWDRSKDISFALDQLLAEPSLKGLIDEKRVGFIGYSLGGMTGLALGGAIASNVKETLIKRLGKYPEMTTEIFDRIDFSEGHANYGDPRIRAILLICPANFIYSSQSLSKVKVPVGLVATLHDEILPHKEHAYPIIKHLIPAKLKLMRKKTSHFAFLNRASKAGKEIFQEALLHNKGKPDPVHAEVGAFATDFFKAHLN